MKKVLSKSYFILILLFLYIPIFVLIVYSFNSSKSYTNWTGFTTHWYRQLLQNEQIMRALLNTIIIAFVSSIVATGLGTTAAIGIYRMKNRPRSLIMNITYIPIINPEIITGVSLMLFFRVFVDVLNLKFGFFTLIIAHITFNVPYVIFSVFPKLKQMDPHLMEAAQDLGCNERQAFFKVAIPQILPGVLSGFLLAITYSIDDFVISYFNSGTSVETLPITIASMTRRKVSPEINALSALIFVVVAIILIVKNMYDNQKLRELKLRK